MDNKPQFVITFIELYKSLPCLWKVKDDCYQNKRLKNEAYDKLVAFYKTAVPTATTDSVKRKINNLRSAFRKELKKVKSQNSGSADDATYTSSLWYFDLLMFTADQDIPRNNTASVSTAEIDENETFCEEDAQMLWPSTSYSSPPSPLSSLPPQQSLPPLPSHSPLPSYSPQSSSQSRHTKLSSSKKSTGNKRKRPLINDACKPLNEYDEYDGIGLNVACKLRRMNDEQRLHAELLINKIVLYGISNRLQEETSIADVVPAHSEMAHRDPLSNVSGCSSDSN